MIYDEGALRYDIASRGYAVIGNEARCLLMPFVRWWEVAAIPRFGKGNVYIAKGFTLETALCKLRWKVLTREGQAE